MRLSPIARAGSCMAALVLSFCIVTAAAAERVQHELDLRLDPLAGRLEAADRIEVEGHDRLALRLAPGLELGEVVIDGRPAAPVFEEGVHWIELPDDGAHRVVLAYGGGLDSQPDGNGLAPHLTPAGAFLPYGLGWLARAGDGDDRGSYELTVTVPSPMTAVATGRLVAEREAGGVYQATFAGVGVAEPPSVFAGDYRVEERDHHGIRLRTYFPAEKQSLSARYLDQAAGYIDLFAARIGDYPYDGFSMVAAPLPVGLGFPGLTYVAAQILDMPFMQTRSLAHEILHNWWANGVFVDGGNWAEGLTTYMADYALAEAQGADAAWQMRLGWLRDFAALPAARDRPAISFRSKGHDADQVVGYNKIAMIFHMLRQEIGKIDFEAGLRAFWRTHKFGVAGWSDLQASFEASAGRPLAGFFEPWLTRKGAPALTLESAEVVEGDGGFGLELGLSSDVDAYDLRIPVQVETEAGVEEHLVRLRDGRVATTLDLDARPLAIGIDQRHDLFRRLAADEAPPIFRDVTLRQDVLTVIAVRGDPDTRAVAAQLAERVLDTEGRFTSLNDEALDHAPLMLVGLAADMAPALAEIGLGAAPAALEGRGTARSWVAQRVNAPPVLVVEAADRQALGALLRPLPHYGRSSYLVFDGRHVIDKGVWPSGENALTRRFE